MPIINPFYKEKVKTAALFHEAKISFSENEECATVSAEIPQTTAEYIRNFRFWKWFFNEAMRNFGTSAFLYSCTFLSDWKPRIIIPLSSGGKLLRFFGARISEKIIPATGNLVEVGVGFTVSVHKDIVLQLSKKEFDKLRALGLTCVEEVERDAYPYKLHLNGNVLSAKMIK